MEKEIVNSGGISLYTLSIVVIVVAIGVVGYVGYKKKQKLKAFEKEENIEKEAQEKVKEEIRKKLIKLENDFEKKSIAYYLPTLLLDSNLEENKKDSLIAKNLYKNKRVYSQPIILWDDFTKMGEGEVLDKFLKEKIKNFKDRDKYTLKGAFETMLLKQAKQKTIDIIKREELKV